MENRLFSLFDYQRFQKNQALAGIINDTEARHDGVLVFPGRAPVGDDLAELINAAGDIATLENLSRKDEKTT